jgi:predicted DNA-binding transcriptional regulator AlpA
MHAQPNKSLRPTQAAEYLGIAVSTLWRFHKDRPDFPRSRKIGPRCTVFDHFELMQWRDSQITKN